MDFNFDSPNDGESSNNEKSRKDEMWIDNSEDERPNSISGEKVITTSENIPSENGNFSHKNREKEEKRSGDGFDFDFSDPVVYVSKNSINFNDTITSVENLSSIDFTNDSEKEQKEVPSSRAGGRKGVRNGRRRRKIRRNCPRKKHVPLIFGDSSVFDFDSKDFPPLADMMQPLPKLKENDFVPILKGEGEIKEIFGQASYGPLTTICSFCTFDVVTKVLVFVTKAFSEAADMSLNKRNFEELRKVCEIKHFLSGRRFGSSVFDKLRSIFDQEDNTEEQQEKLTRRLAKRTKSRVTLPPFFPILEGLRIGGNLCIKLIKSMEFSPVSETMFLRSFLAYCTKYSFARAVEFIFQRSLTRKVKLFLNTTDFVKFFTQFLLEDNVSIVRLYVDYPPCKGKLRVKDKKNIVKSFQCSIFGCNVIRFLTGERNFEIDEWALLYNSILYSNVDLFRFCLLERKEKIYFENLNLYFVDMCNYGSVRLIDVFLKNVKLGEEDKRKFLEGAIKSGKLDKVKLLLWEYWDKFKGCCDFDCFLYACRNCGSLEGNEILQYLGYKKQIDVNQNGGIAFVEMIKNKFHSTCLFFMKKGEMKMSIENQHEFFLIACSRLKGDLFLGMLEYFPKTPFDMCEGIYNCMIHNNFSKNNSVRVDWITNLVKKAGKRNCIFQKRKMDDAFENCCSRGMYEIIREIIGVFPGVDFSQGLNAAINKNKCDFNIIQLLYKKGLKEMGEEGRKYCMGQCTDNFQPSIFSLFLNSGLVNVNDCIEQFVRKCDMLSDKNERREMILILELFMLEDFAKGGYIFDRKRFLYRTFQLENVLLINFCIKNSKLIFKEYFDDDLFDMLILNSGVVAWKILVNFNLVGALKTFEFLWKLKWMNFESELRVEIKDLIELLKTEYNPDSVEISSLLLKIVRDCVHKGGFQEKYLEVFRIFLSFFPLNKKGYGKILEFLWAIEPDEILNAKVFIFDVLSNERVLKNLRQFHPLNDYFLNRIFNQYKRTMKGDNEIKGLLKVLVVNHGLKFTVPNFLTFCEYFQQGAEKTNVVKHLLKNHTKFYRERLKDGNLLMSLDNLILKKNFNLFRIFINTFDIKGIEKEVNKILEREYEMSFEHFLKYFLSDETKLGSLRDRLSKK